MYIFQGQGPMAPLAPLDPLVIIKHYSNKIAFVKQWAILVILNPRQNQGQNTHNTNKTNIVLQDVGTF